MSTRNISQASHGERILQILYENLAIFPGTQAQEREKPKLRYEVTVVNSNTIGNDMRIAAGAEYLVRGCTMENVDHVVRSITMGI